MKCVPGGFSICDEKIISQESKIVSRICEIFFGIKTRSDIRSQNLLQGINGRNNAHIIKV
jgi:hypothetical protein